VLVWRNRRGETAYCWERREGKAKVLPPAKKTEAATTNVLPPPPPKKTVSAAKAKLTRLDMPSSDSVTTTSSKNSPKLTPRSASSGMSSNETAGITAEMASAAMTCVTSLAEDQQGEVAVAEMKMLMEMARNRLLAGDVYTSMRYITLAQQVQPLVASFGYTA
jgi:hypothetical protein